MNIPFASPLASLNGLARCVRFSVAFGLALASYDASAVTLTVNDSANASDWSAQTNLQAGSQQYGDRTYQFTSIPATLQGSDWIRTANDSKAYTTDPLVSFTVDEDTDVYVAHNDLITTKPSWLQSGWTDTGLDITNNESTPRTFSLFKKTFTASSTVSLGANGDTAVGMYIVVLQPVPPTFEVVVHDATNASDWSYLSDLQTGDLQYGDRTYQISSVPASLQGANWIRTANDSKGYTSDPVVTITLDMDTDVYVAHNDLITTKPSWLQSGWTDTGLNITNNESTPKTFSLYKQTFAQGSEVELGANGDTAYGMYTIILTPALPDDQDPSLVEIESEKDAYVRGGVYANANFGATSELWVKEANGSDYDRETFLQFDLTGTGGSVNAAVLELLPATVGVDAATSEYQVKLVTDDSWTETGITWNNRPSGSIVIATVDGSTISQGQPLEIDVTEVADSEAAGDGVLSLVMVPLDLGDERHVIFASHESGSNGPRLLVDTDAVSGGVIAFSLGNFSDYGGQTGTSGTNTVSLDPDDTAVRLEGNIWVKYPYAYDVTPLTVLKVTVDASSVGEIIGIGLDDDDVYNNSWTNYKLAGSQSLNSLLRVDADYIQGQGPVTYIIPIGKHFTGSMAYLTFLGDDDTGSGVDVTFSDIELYEESAMGYQGQVLVLSTWGDWPWDASQSDTSFGGTLTAPENGGTAAAFNWSNPRTGVDITDPEHPDDTASSASYFGFEGTGFGVGDSTTGRFNRGESFTMQCAHDFWLDRISWKEVSGDELVHVSWTSGGVPQERILVITGSYSRPWIRVDANTPVVFTNVSPSTSSLGGRLRIEYFIAELVYASEPEYDPSGADGFVQMSGVNLAGAEFGGFAFYPTESAQWDYYQAKGLKLMRIPFKWERVQSSLYGSLTTSTLNSLDTIVALAEARGMKVILDMHNYARYNGNLIGSTAVPNSAFEDVWQKLADHFKNETAIYGYGIMNEPNGTGGLWPAAAQAGVDGIRAVDSDHWVIVAGDNWSSATSWRNSNPNLDVYDAEGMVIYEAHCYFDSNADGDYGSYDSENLDQLVGPLRVNSFLLWLQEKGYRGFVGEYGIPGNDVRWNPFLDQFLKHIFAYGLSGTYWAGGMHWSNYDLNCSPSSNYTVDSQQMEVLEDYTF